MSRFDYVVYDEISRDQQMRAKRLCVDLERLITELNEPGMSYLPEQDLAVVKLEETYMWIGKAVRNRQIARNGGATVNESRTNG